MLTFVRDRGAAGQRSRFRRPGLAVAVLAVIAQAVPSVAVRAADESSERMPLHAPEQ
jgi:hypothetical protein